MEELVVVYADWIRMKAGRLYSNSEDADDLAGETIYKCLANAGRFKNGMSFKPWAKTIMENTFKSQYNRRQRVLFTGYDSYDSYECGEYADQSVSVSKVLSVVRDCYRKSCCIKCVILYAKGFSYDEISCILDIPVGTVKSRVASGRRMIRAALGD